MIARMKIGLGKTLNRKSKPQLKRVEVCMNKYKEYPNA
jgi:hypothetical protein